MSLPDELLRKLPKTDLHCHLDGSIRTSTIIELAREQGYPLPADNVEELRPYVRVPLDCRSLGDFLARFEVFYPLLTNPAALERISYELMRDCSAENVKYLEIRFAPVLQKTDSFPISQVVESVLAGIKKGERDYPIRGGLLLCLYRGTLPEDSIETVGCAISLRENGVCGIDIAGDESRYPLEDFITPVKMAREAGVNITIHAGEAAGAEYIKEAVAMGANRIGHGVTLAEDPALMEELARKEVPLEICITSNVHTQVVKDYETHPFRKFVENGVKVTLNTDDRGVSGIDLTYEYEKASELGLSLEDIQGIMINGVEAAFLDKEEKEELKTIFLKEIKEVTGGYDVKRRTY
ncbi:MAG: adenosine deaminase [Elusimicrobiota bacterium]